VAPGGHETANGIDFEFWSNLTKTPRVLSLGTLRPPLLVRHAGGAGHRQELLALHRIRPRHGCQASLPDAHRAIKRGRRKNPFVGEGEPPSTRPTSLRSVGR
jgi:hypothetical protein